MTFHTQLLGYGGPDWCGLCLHGDPGSPHCEPAFSRGIWFPALEKCTLVVGGHGFPSVLSFLPGEDGVKPFSPPVG